MGIEPAASLLVAQCIIQLRHFLANTYYIWQMKHQLDATLCRFYFYSVILHVSGASVHHQEYLKLVQRPLVHVLSLQVSHHISLLGSADPNKEMW